MIHVEAGEDLYSAFKGMPNSETLILGKGIHKPSKFLYRTSIRNITIRGEDGAIIEAPSGAYAAMKLEGFAGITIENLGFTKGTKPGLFAVSGKVLNIRSCVSYKNGGSGILTADVESLIVDKCSTNENGEHGIYASQFGTDYIITNNCCSYNGRTGIQINGNKALNRAYFSGALRNVLAVNVSIYNNVLMGNQAVGDAGCIHLFCVRHANVYDNQIVKHEGRDGITLWDDGKKSPNYACQDIDIKNVTFDFAYLNVRANIYVSRNSKNIRIDKTNKYDARYPTIGKDRGVEVILD